MGEPFGKREIFRKYPDVVDVPQLCEMLGGSRPVEGNALHPVGLLATIAQGSLILDDACADEWLRRFFSTPLRSGPRRYYDNCLYLFALLALSGHYRIWFPQEATV